MRALVLRNGLAKVAVVLGIAVLLLLAPRTASAQMGASSAAVQEFTQNVQGVLFPFNVYNKTVNTGVLDSDADYLKQHPDTQFWIQGHADNRGDVVYNLALSYRRAQFVKSNLIKRGVSASQIGFATGWGKLYPICEANDDSCWQQNRRVDMVLPDNAL